MHGNRSPTNIEAHGATNDSNKHLSAQVVVHHSIFCKLGIFRTGPAVVAVGIY